MDGSGSGKRSCSATAQELPLPLSPWFGGLWVREDGFPGAEQFGAAKLPDADIDAYDCEIEEVPEEAAMPADRPQPRYGSRTKRSRAAEVHNMSEKRRRSRINEKMRALQNLIPNSNKTDKASMLDEAIEYLKQLQLQVQMLSMRNGSSLHNMYFSGMAQPPLQASQISMGYGSDIRPVFNTAPGMLPINSESLAHNLLNQENQSGALPALPGLTTAEISFDMGPSLSQKILVEELVLHEQQNVGTGARSSTDDGIKKLGRCIESPSFEDHNQFQTAIFGREEIKSMLPRDSTGHLSIDHLNSLQAGGSL